MEILKTIMIILGGLCIVLFIVATIVIMYNKKMTSTGKILRIGEIFIWPILGPIAVLMEVLYWKEKEEKLKDKRRETGST